MKNKHGLSRIIDDPTKRLIRQKSGFGCIFCGNWIYQYEHIDPEFNDATEHDASKICLLCATHHQKVTSGRISKQQVLNQYNHPIALSKGYASDYLELHAKFYVALGRIFFVDTKKILSVDGIELLSIEQPSIGEPMRLNAKFFDSKGNLILEIIKNEMVGFTKNWDIEQKGTRTIVRRKRGDIVLQINILPPDVIEVEILNMVYGSAKVDTNSKTGKIYIHSKNGATVDLFKGQIITEGLTVVDTGISFDKVMMIGVQEGLELGELDYRAFIDSGRIQSLPSKTN
jgi:hypothetical protein